jgi:uncharacterized RDD family membrane protein YckC
VLEPLVPPVGDLSHWDMRLSQMPRERSPDFESPTSPLPRPAPPPEARPEPIPTPRPELKVAPRPEPRRAPAPAASGDATVEVDVGPIEVHLERAPDWRRVGAWVLDGVPFLALFALVLRFALDHLPHGPLDLLGYLDLAGQEAPDVTAPILGCVLVLFLVYHALAQGLSGATLGKRLLGLRVVCRNGRRPGLGRATLRAVLAGLSVALLGLGVLLALFTRSGRTLHDFLARTWVVQAP